MKSNWRTALIAFVLSLTASVLTLSVLRQRMLADVPNAEAKIQLDAPEVWARLVDGSSEVSALVTIRNAGDRRMIVRVTEAACDCDQSVIQPLSIPPRSSATAEIPIYLDQESNQKHWRFLIRSNDPQNPELPLLVKWPQ